MEKKKHVGKTNSPTVWVSRNVLFLVCIFFYITAVLFEWIRAVAIMVVRRSKEIWGWGCTFYSFSYHLFCKMATGLAKSSKVIFYAWKSFDIYFSISISEWKMKRKVCYCFKFLEITALPLHCISYNKTAFLCSHRVGIH